MENIHFKSHQLNSFLNVFLSEDTFKLFDKVTSVIFFLYILKPGKFLFISNSTDKIIGYPAQKLFEEGIDFIASKIHPEDYPIAFAECGKMLKENNTPNYSEEKDVPKRIELRIKNNEGDWIWTEINFIILDYTNDGVSKIFGIMEEINNDKEKYFGDTVIQDFKFLTDSTYMSRKNHDYHLESLIDISLKSNAYKKVTRREKEVLKLVADGFTAKELANKLFISIHTAINHRKNLITKFHVKNTAELIKVASKYFWL